jgi:hypothetical protein
MSVSSLSFSTQYAYDMGSDAVLLERNEDEVSGITPGLAMLRGAANQHGGKDWGIDMSTWRYWNNGPTQFVNGRLLTGGQPARLNAICLSPSWAVPTLYTWKLPILRKAHLLAMGLIRSA